MKELVQVNPEMIVLAREVRGLTQKQLAEASGIKQPQIAMIEGGIENAASSETLGAVARALNFPNSFFVTDETRLGFGSSSVYYRKKAAMAAAERRVISSLTNLNRIGLRRMLDVVDVDASLPLPMINLERSGGLPAHAASTVRAAWNLPDGPIANLTQIMERAGIVIIECNFGDSIDGTCMRLSGLPPLVFVNKSLAPDRYRYTLAHELGHLVMHDVPKETMEDEADEFASELLMQELEFKVAVAPFGARPSLKQLVQLKPYWKVSIASMIMRMRQIGQITDATKRSLFILMSNYKMRMNEPQPFPKEVPSLQRKIVQAAIAESGFDEQARVSFMKMPEDVFRQLYGAFLVENSVASQHLRLV